MTSTLNHQLRIIQAPVFAEETHEIIDANNSTYEKNILATFWTLLTSSSLPHQEVTHKKLHQISWNQSKKSFAISLSSETSLAHIFINKNGTWLTPPLFNSKQGRTTLCMTWLPFSDTLLVGTLSGVCLWRIFALSMQESEQSWMSYLPTPNHHETDFIQPSPFGRFFATACKRDRVIYIWDSYYLTSTTLFCLSSTSCVSSMEWSADGQYILVGGSDGSVVVVLCESWTVLEVCQLPAGAGTGTGSGSGASISHAAWITPTTCVICPQHSLSFYSIQVASGGVGDPQSRDVHLGGPAQGCCPEVALLVLPSPLDLRATGSMLEDILLEVEKCGEMCMGAGGQGQGGGDWQARRESCRQGLHVESVSSSAGGGFLALSVALNDASCPTGYKTKTMPFVLVYLCSAVPFLALTRVSVAQAPRGTSSSVTPPATSQDAVATASAPYPMSFKFCDSKIFSDKNQNFRKKSCSIVLSVIWSNEMVSLHDVCL